LSTVGYSRLSLLPSLPFLAMTLASRPGFWGTPRSRGESQDRAACGDSSPFGDVSQIVNVYGLRTTEVERQHAHTVIQCSCSPIIYHGWWMLLIAAAAEFMLTTTANLIAIDVSTVVWRAARCCTPRNGPPQSSQSPLNSGEFGKSTTLRDCSPTELAPESPDFPDRQLATGTIFIGP